MAAATANPSAPGSSVSASAVSGWVSALRFGALTVCIGVVLSLLAQPWLPLSWWKVFRRCASIAAALSVWIILSKIEHRSIRSYGLGDWRAGKRQLAFGLLLGAGTLAVLLGGGVLVGVCRINLTPDLARFWRTLIGFVPAALLVSVLEELVFRGILLQHLQRASTPMIGMLLSSALYAVVHVKHAPFAMGTFLDLVGLFLLGCVLAMTYAKTGQLYLAIGLHASLAYGVRVDKLFIEFPEPSWLGGTSRIVNGLPGWLALLGLAGVIIWWARSARRRIGERRHE